MKKSLKFVLATVVFTLSCVSVNADIGLKAGSYIDRELECLAKNIYHEAGGESYEGKVAVAQVAVNRTENGNFPSSICGVISQKTLFACKFVCQCSWYCNSKRSIKLDTELYEESYEVAKRVLLDGYRLSTIRHALYFHNINVNPRWNLIKVAKIGNHVFYRDKRQT